jgi:ribosome biogenesis GTPase A
MYSANSTMAATMTEARRALARRGKEVAMVREFVDEVAPILTMSARIVKSLVRAFGAQTFTPKERASGPRPPL